MQHRQIASNIVRCCLGLLFAVVVLFIPVALGAQSNAAAIGNGAISIYAGVQPGATNGLPNDNVPANQYGGLASNNILAMLMDSHQNLYLVNYSVSGNISQVLMVYAGGPTPALLQYRLTRTSIGSPTAGNIYIIADYANVSCTPPDPCGDGASALDAGFAYATGLALDSAGSLYITDEATQSVRKISASTGNISTIVGDPMHENYGYSGENVAALGSLLSAPTAVAFDTAGDLYIADGGNAIIRKVDATTNKITTVAGTVPSPSGIGTPSSDGTTFTNPCSTSVVPCGNGGAPLSAYLYFPASLFFASNGDLYIADYAQVVWKVNYSATTPVIEAVAGTMPSAENSGLYPDQCLASPPPTPVCGDNGTATQALLGNPNYAALDTVGNLLIADQLDNALRYVNTANPALIQDAIGQTNATPGSYSNGNGTGISATLVNPTAFVFDPSGNLFIADSGDGVIRKVTAPAALTPQTITFNTLPNITYGAAAFTLDATASSGLTVSYAVTGPATLSGTSLHVNGTGLVTVTASQAGNSTYAPATPVAQSFTVEKATLTVTANNLSRPVNAANPTLTYAITGLVNGDQASAVSGTPVLSTTATTNSPTGSYPITITAGTLAAANYTFNLVNGTLTVSGLTQQTITFAALSNLTYGSSASTFNLAATASSGLPVSFSVTGPAVLQGDTLTVNGAGTVTVTAQQQGNDTYEAAPNVVRSFTVNPAPLVITAVNAARGYDQPNPAFTFTATGFVGGDTMAVLSGAPAFATTATLTSPPGTYPITLTQGTLFSANYSFVFVAGALSVGLQAQTITFQPIPVLQGVSGATYTLVATATSNLPVQFTATGAATIIGGNVLQFTGPGAVVVTASQPGNADYAPATPVVQNIVLGLVPANVTALPATRAFGAPNPTFTYQILQGGGAAFIPPGTTTGLPALSTTATTSSPTGTYPIVISAGTLTSTYFSFTYVNSDLTVTSPASYTLTVNPSSVTVPIGQSRQVTLTLTPLNLYTGSVTLSCSGLPAGVTCVSSPASLTADGSGSIVQGTLTISAGQVVASNQQKMSTVFAAGFFWLPAGLAGFWLTIRRRKLRAAWPGFFVGILLLLVASVTGLSACGGGSSHGGSSIQPGTTQVMVTGTGTDSATSAGNAQSVALTVVIQ